MSIVLSASTPRRPRAVRGDPALTVLDGLREMIDERPHAWQSGRPIWEQIRSGHIPAGTAGAVIAAA